MKKLFSILILGILILSGVVAADFSNKETNISEKIEDISLSNHLEINEKDGYLSIALNGANSSMMETGKPILPVFRKTYTFSSTVKIKEVTCTYSNITEKMINGKIIPGPRVIKIDEKSIEKQSTKIENKEIYDSESLYPGSWYDYSIKCGINQNGVSTTYVIIEIHPVQYSPKLNMLYYIDNVKIQIKYVDPGYKISKNSMESYDLVIIAPKKFSSALQPLIDHKNDHGVKTILKTTEDIYLEFNGRDKPEQIKYFIKYAKETWGITYVLLVGGLKSYIYADDRENKNEGSTDWNVPVRYTNIISEDEKGCISDLYYSDIYKYNQSSEQWEFDNWDSNGNNILAEHSGIKKDIIDFAPDVFYGRLPCINILEVKLLVKKIIKYESSSPEEKPWLKTMVGIGGKTFEIYQGQPDGEYLCDVAINYMGDLIDKNVTVYATNNNTGGLVPVPKDIISAITKGAGYVIFEGHGNPMVWDTIWADGEYPKDWAGGLSIIQMPKILNFAKLPIVIVGGCHNALFNLSILQIIKNRKDHYNYYWTYFPTPICFSWELCLLPWGGAIGSTGCTGYGIGYEGKPISLNAELETNFFYEIGQNGSTTLGSAHGGSILKFITDNSPIKTADQYHCLSVYQLFGDPSLKLGGFSK
jgi:hypothetical protein